MLVAGVFLLLVAIGVQASQLPNRFMISAKPSEDCPESSHCITLLDCLNRTTPCLRGSNTEVVFLPGEHKTDGFSEFVVVRRVSGLTLKGSIENGTSSAIIKCTTHVGFAFMAVNNLTIHGLSFSNCGKSISQSLKTEAVDYETSTYMHFFEGTKMAFLLANVTNFNMSYSEIINSSGYGLFAINVLGQSIIDHCKFAYNNINALSKNSTYGYTEIFERIASCTGGNAVILFQDTLKCPNVFPSHEFLVAYTEFSYGVNLDNSEYIYTSPSYLGTAGGLTIVSGQNSYALSVTIDHCSVHSNVGLLAANVGIIVHDSYHRLAETRLSFFSTNIANGNADDSEDFISLAHSGGVYIYYGDPAAEKFPVCDESNSSYIYKNISFQNCILFSNFGFSGAALLTESTISSMKSIIPVVSVKNCTIHNNTAVNAVVRTLQVYDIERDYSDSSHQLHFDLVDVVISHNKHVLRDPPRWVYGITAVVHAAIDLFKLTISHLENCIVESNQATGLYLRESTLIISGTIHIRENKAEEFGGGMYFYNSHLKSKACPQYPLELYIDNNEAQFGGGIFVNNIVLFVNPFVKCFFVDSSTPLINPEFIHIVMSNNTAQIAGNSIYGGLLDKCRAETYPHSAKGTDLFYRLFTIVSKNLTEISSEVHVLCFCNGDVPHCDIHSWEVSAFPGQLFHIPAVGIGQLGGTVPSVALAELKNGTLDPQQDAQPLGIECGQLAYRVKSSELQVQLELRANYERTLNPAKVVIRNVILSLKECPEGFSLQSEQCDCIQFLKDRDISCNIDNQTFHRPVPLWIGYQQEENLVLLHQSCPLDYCKTESVDMTLNQTDIQCQFNRSGILCGGCQQGLSVVLGTSQCKKCSSAFISLLPLFLVAGFLLVLLMIYCDLTVAKGTFNGLVFYANIVRVNHSIIFPPGHSNILTVFIAWLNLDLGIEACFYDGMDEYARAWLQFAFPVYIWAVAGVIVAATWYSSLATKVAGRNAVAVLATLFLLSYTKVQRAVFTALSFTYVSTQNGDKLSVWVYDGNVQFHNPKHVVLFTFALIVALGFVFPFTLVVSLGPLLQAKFSWWMMRYKLTPFLDAYQGPYKDRFRWWTGMLLVFRSSLLLAFVLNIFDSPELNLLLIVSTTVVLLGAIWNVGAIYKRILVNILEAFYLVNLALLAAVTKYTARSSSKAQPVLVYILVGSAFAVFVAILLYSIVVQLQAFKRTHNIHPLQWFCCRQKACSSDQEMQSVGNEELGSPVAVVRPPPSVSYIDVRARESLLFDSSN